MLAKMVGLGAAGVLAAGVGTVAINSAVPSEFKHNVTVDGGVSVSVNVDVNVHTPDLDKLKPGSLVPPTVELRLPEGFTLNLPDTEQKVNVKAPTDYTVHQAK